MKWGVLLITFVLAYLMGWNSGFNIGYGLIITRGIELKLVECPRVVEEEKKL